MWYVVICIVYLQSNLHRKLYGESVLLPKNSAANRIIESTEVLKLQEQKNEKQQQKQQQQQLQQQQQQQQAAKQPQQFICHSHDSNSLTVMLHSVYWCYLFHYIALWLRNGLMLKFIWTKP